MEINVKKYVEELLMILRPISAPNTFSTRDSHVAINPPYIKNSYKEIANDPSLAFEISTDKVDQTLHKARDGSGSEITFRCDARTLAVIKAQIYSEDICEVEIPSNDKESYEFLRAQEKQAICFWERVHAIIIAGAEIIA